MSEINLQQFCESACDLVGLVADFIRQELGKVKTHDVEAKALNSLVSYVDTTAEKRLVEGLSALLPGSKFLTEEKTVAQEEGRFRWIIDPLDGTTNFLHQLPFFSVSVALQEEGQTVIGIVYEVNQKECFYAWKGGGAFLNGTPIKVSDTNSIQEALVATGFPYYDYSYMGAYFQVLEYLMLNTRGIRRLGSAALDLAYVACGRFDGYFEYSINSWDVAGGAFLVQEAGGKVCDFRGGSGYLHGRKIIATNQGIAPEMLEVVSSAFVPS